jgi:hypothetical protein
MQMLYWPALLMLVVAGVLLLLAVGHGVASHRRWRDRRRMAASWRAVLGLVFLALALVAGSGGMALRGYRVLGRETPVATVVAHKAGPQFWHIELQLPGGHTRTVPLDGDDFRLEAVVVKWKLPAELAGVKPLYRLDRLSGRYENAGQASEARATIYDLRAPGPDLFDLRHRYPDWLPMVDTQFGSGVYMPLVDGGRYKISLMATGALVVRPDAATKKRLDDGTG